MKFVFGMPTRLFFGSGALKEHAQELADMGGRAVILTGRHSAKLCGALDDVLSALDEKGVAHALFDAVENNPSTETAAKAAQLCKEFQADFVIGIGGGSPIDAAKAAAVLSANPGMKPEELFGNAFQKALPVAAVPTTAGTGSEATQYSVLWSRDLDTKMGFGSQLTFPACAFLDAKYTASLSRTVTADTAVDAFLHSLESFLSNRSTPVTDALALDGIATFGRCLPALASDAEITPEVREELLYASLLGGIAISQTSVTLVHGMGYCYTCYKNAPHGRANGFLAAEYLRYISAERPNKLKIALNALNMADVNELDHALTALIGPPPALSDSDVELFTGLSLLQKGSIANTARKTGVEEIKMLWSKMAERAKAAEEKGGQA